MNTKYIKLIALFATLPTLLFAQQSAKPDATLTERGNQPPSAVTAEGTDKTNVDTSDAGAQRPIFLKTENISAFAGLDTKYLYRNNPLSSSDKLSFIETAMWMNTAYAGASFEAVETDNSVIIPYVGASYTSTEYLQSGLDGLDFTSTSAYAMLLAQHSSGWTFRTGVSYAMDSSQLSSDETYKEFYPYIGAMKSHSLGDSVIGALDISGGLHMSDSDSFDSSYNGNRELQNVDTTAAYSLRFIFEKIVISPRYGITYKKYFYGPNDNRDDLLHSVNLKIDYIVNENLNISIFGGYSNRDSSGGTYQDAGILSYDFESADGGIALGLNTTF